MNSLDYSKRLKKICFSLLLGFIAYSLGRIGHIYGGQLKTPHHYIYGIVAIILSAIFYKKPWSIYLFSIGVGLLISDFDDFLALKTFQPDTVETKRFWGVD